MAFLRKKKNNNLKINQALLLGSVKSQGRRGGVGIFHFQLDHLYRHLMQAVNAGNSEVVRTMLEGGEFTLEDIEMGTPALLCSCYRGYLETALVLLNFGAQPDDLGESGCAPIHEAARNGHTGTIALLLDRGANVNLPSKFEKKTALHVAASKGKHKAVELLLENSAKVDKRDIYGATALCTAAGSGCYSTVQLLLSNGAALDSFDNSGWTSLHLAAQAGHADIVRLLLNKNASINCQNHYGRTPLHCACLGNHLNIVVVLLDFRADVDVKDIHHRKAIDYTSDSLVSQILKPLVQNDMELIAKPGVRSIGEFVNIKSPFN